MKMRVSSASISAGEFPEHVRHGGHDGEQAVKFYILGDKYLMDDRIMDKALEAILRISSDRCVGRGRHIDSDFALSPAAVKAALTSLDVASPMGRLAIDQVCRG